VPPGHYHAEVGATLDGERWSPVSAAFGFVVDRPWYLRAWALGALGACILSAGYAAYRLRLAVHLRLERQRARIAMDLHDEMGSALGAIGILAGVATQPSLADVERCKLAAQIADTAEGLGEVLGDIVWSLHEGSAKLDALFAHLRERAGRLFPGATTTLVIDAPEPVPGVPLSVPVCGQVQRIALEALHNAARHAGARRIVLGLAPAGGRRWRLSVEDDGVGLPTARATRGLGLTSMRRRARELGAELELESSAAGGTRVALVFEPGTEGLRPATSHDRAKDAAR